MERILIVRLGAMGDVVHALPAAAALRQALPQARIDWLIEPRWAELLCASGGSSEGPRSEQRPLVDSIIPVDTKRWRRALCSASTWRDAGAALRRLRTQRYELALDLQGSLKSAAFARLSAAHTVAGSARPRESLARILYGLSAQSQGVHVIDQNLGLALCAAAASVPGAGSSVARKAPQPAWLPRDPQAVAWAQAELASRGLTRFALLSPGAGWPAKEWPAERYGEVARGLARDGLASLINIGPGGREAALADVIERGSGESARRIQCSLGRLIALTRRASLFVGGDTGPMHLANALGVPIVALFGPTDPARNGPYYTPSIVLRSPASRTSYSHGRALDPGLLEIDPDRVLEAARTLLAS
jgi:heptosyltransferase-1